MKYNILSDEQKKGIVEMYMNGISIKDICVNFNTNTTTIHRLLKKHGIKRSRRNETETLKEKKPDIVKAYKAGEKIEDIKAKFGVNCTSSLYNILRKSKVKRRKVTYNAEKKQEDIISAYLAGETTNDIVRKFHLGSPLKLYEILRMHDVKLRGKVKLQKQYKKLWMKRYREVKSFHENTGRFPITSSVDKYERGLGLWCKSMRDAKNGISRKEITDDQILLLDSIGFNWESITPWMIRYNAYKEFVHKNGRHPSQTSNDKEEVVLYFWGARQRQARRAHSKLMNNEKISYLDSIGFEWGKNIRIPIEDRCLLVRKISFTKDVAQDVRAHNYRVSKFICECIRKAKKYDKLMEKEKDGK